MTTTTLPVPPASGLLLGVDPGLETGLAGVDAETGEALFVTSATPLAALRQIEELAATGALRGVWIEDARRLPIYARHQGANRGERDRIARSVGRVDALTSLYLSLCKALALPVEAVEPVRAAKWDAETAARLTGYAGRTNEHGRDALRHVYGRAPVTAARPSPAPPHP